MQCIYLIRHGQSQGQAHNTVHDELTPLSPQGKRQMESLIPYLAKQQITKLYTSPLQRAVGSASILADAMGISYEVEEDFGEWNFHGGFVGTWEEHRNLYPQLFIASGVFDPDYKLEGGESYNEFVARVHARAKQLKGESGNIAVVSHFCALNIVTNTLLNLPIREEFYFEFANGSISKFSPRLELSLRMNFSNRTFY